MAETEGATLKLAYNVQPWVGVLTWSQDEDMFLLKKMKGGLSKVFNLPAIKAKTTDGTKS